MSRYLCLDDFEAAAKSRLPHPLFTYISSAAETSSSLRDNRDVFGKWGFVPRVLRGVSGRSISCDLLGKTYDAPFGIAPMGISALMAYYGDDALTRAAASHNIPMVLSGSSLTPMEAVFEANRDSWFQAYLPGEDDKILALVNRVKRTGFKTLVLTVDTAVLANRENNLRAGFSTPLRLTPKTLWQFATHPRWVLGTFARTLMTKGMPHFENSYATRGAPIMARNVMRDFGRKDHLNWDHLRLIRDHWQGKLIVKGVLAAADVGEVAKVGCDAVVLSNHGGRQLDGAISPMRVLPNAVSVAGNMPVMVDGGFRRETDILKALALGAAFVFVGRPFLYAAVVDGERGVSQAVEILKSELHRDLGLLGKTTLSEIEADILMTH
ncbi:MAG: alpha-hydroxy-acid oxidizing protein [Thalassospira sp.]|uniref:alpha-hydroxy acid oxidase n=1 Tax=Thalassospira sp. TaxID=1912094 RepID=UPI001B267CA5|nr:alpha-hydroxy acid oxidase [Thalassospira sp.]MBO6577809.1 alpha-hydroxy-acid oxidizing protein [Thalassospira sp.]MBO6803288.1 alpha-hydroxy-acid oxidizing protein [Thalassospira sp.]MBO6818551.1 alpha-hydroxy-acid oxidizing protein [Thalassospira sp.]MBO6888421.1 alpha-hydroxy-acid oxidizing protein [Thalassospira sp.]